MEASMTCRWPSRGRAVASLASLAGIALLPLAAASPAAAARHARLAALAPGALAPRALAPGKWKLLGAAEGGPPALWRAPGRTDWVVWAKTGSSYSVAKLSSHGVSSGTKSVFPAGSWSGVSFEPALVSDGSVPLLIFSGQRNGGGPLAQGCAVGAVPPSSGAWQVQSWSLSHDCTFANTGFGGAAKSRSGQLSAGWAGGGGVEYRLGTSPSIPAGSLDKQITLSTGHAQAVAETSNAAGNGDTYLAFERFFSAKGSQDGVYVKDLTANGALAKAPGSGSNTVDIYTPQPQALPFASSSAHAGVYVAYCANSGCSSVLLWRDGAKKALKVPHSAKGLGIAMSAGPAGRLWLAWYNEASNRVYTVRTNKADTRFGPVRSSKAPCFADGNTHLGLSGGGYGRLDVGLECLSAGAAKPIAEVTQSLAALRVSASKHTIRNSSKVSVTFTVTDAGDRVADATVKVAGHTAKTGSKGTVTITFAKGTKAKKYAVTASLANYFSGHASIRVQS
jgi:hypothetical protein